jgi:predicted esterase
LTGKEVFKRGRFLVRPSATQNLKPEKQGIQKLGIDSRRDGLVYIPTGYHPAHPAPLAVMMHGAGGDPEHGISLLRPVADAGGIILLAPHSREGTWDIILQGSFGRDIIFIDQALTETLAKYAIDSKRLAVGGFSDGASYALSIGLINGDLFTHIIAFSPGFYYSPEMHGKPGIFISHGIQDEILPITYCSRKIVPRLQKEQYSVIYREFDGPHTIPANISLDAAQWFMGMQKGEEET